MTLMEELIWQIKEEEGNLKRVRFMIEAAGEPIRDATVAAVDRVGENIVVVVTPA